MFKWKGNVDFIVEIEWVSILAFVNKYRTMGFGFFVEVLPSDFQDANGIAEFLLTRAFQMYIGISCQSETL